MPKIDVIKFKYELVNKFRKNTRIKIEIIIINIFIETINNDLE